MKVFGALRETEDGEEKEAEQSSGGGGAAGFTEGNRGLRGWEGPGGGRREQEVAPPPGLGPSGLGILGPELACPFPGNCQHRGPQLAPTE